MPSVIMKKGGQVFVDGRPTRLRIEPDDARKVWGQPQQWTLMDGDDCLMKRPGVTTLRRALAAILDACAVPPD
jgi:hypothetical protein